jgi:hypothetical protein
MSEDDKVEPMTNEEYDEWIDRRDRLREKEE